MHFTPESHEDELFDETEAQKQPPAKFKPHFPMKLDEAVQKLTGRPTFNKAFASYKCFFNARKAKIGMRPWSSNMIRDHLVRSGDWTANDFRDEALEYLRYPRKGFNFARQKKRISKLFSNLGLKLLDFNSDNKRAI